MRETQAARAAGARGAGEGSRRTSERVFFTLQMGRVSVAERHDQIKVCLCTSHERDLCGAPEVPTYAGSSGRWFLGTCGAA